MEPKRPQGESLGLRSCPVSRKRGVDRKTTLREQERRREPLRTVGQSHLMESIIFNRLAPKLLAEFIGTFAFVFIGAGAAVGYIASQLVGGVMGALLLRALLGGAAGGLGTPALAHDLALGATTLTVTPSVGFVVEA